MKKLTFIIFFVSIIAQAKTLHPVTVAELKESSVRIMNVEMISGGTGSILKSYTDATYILTNKHICRLIEPGGVVDYKTKQYQITHYKKFKEHDLCLIRISESLDTNLEVADVLAKVSDTSIVSGHPSLLPHIATRGHLSERQDIELVEGIRPCTKKELVDDTAVCLWFGGKPAIVTLDSQLISNLIKPGNSGSAVFNNEGYLIGVVFAGAGRDFSYGFIVPQIYLLYFLQNVHRFEWIKVGTKVDDRGLSDRIFDYQRCKDIEFEKEQKYKKIKDFCKRVNDTMIWNK